MATMVNVGCGPFRAPPPWVNLDCVDNDNTHPDLVVDAARPLADFPAASADRIYLGHVVEHVPWPDVPAFLADVLATLRPGGEVAVVGPDVLLTIEGYRSGKFGWEAVIAALEDRAGSPGMQGDWPQARHWWNCHEDRVEWLLTEAGFVDVAPQPITPEALSGWPVVAHTQHQCAVTARKPGV